VVTVTALGALIVSFGLSAERRLAGYLAWLPELAAAGCPPPARFAGTVGLAIVGCVDVWDIYLTGEVSTWLDLLQASDPKTADLVDDAIYALSCSGPALGRPLVDTISGSKIKNLKELRPGSSGTSEVRILFVFDPWRSAILLIAGDKSGRWKRWYTEAIARGEQLYEIYLEERAEQESGQ